MLVVLFGVAWALGTLGLMGYEITVLTALILSFDYRHWCAQLYFPYQ